MHITLMSSKMEATRMTQVSNRTEDIKLQRAALYIRVYTDEQALHGDSLSTQRELLTAYAKSNSM